MEKGRTYDKRNVHRLKSVNERIIQNTFWSNVDNPLNLAVMLPGYRYPSDAPLFHFTKMHFLEKGWAVVTIDYRYNENPEFLKLTNTEQNSYIKSEAFLIRDSIKEKLHILNSSESLGLTMDNNFNVIKYLVE